MQWGKQTVVVVGQSHYRLTSFGSDCGFQLVGGGDGDGVVYIISPSSANVWRCFWLS